MVARCLQRQDRSEWPGRFCEWRGLTRQIFPVTYVEPLQEPTTTELQREAQEEAQVFASLGESADACLPEAQLMVQGWWISCCRL